MDTKANLLKITQIRWPEDMEMALREIAAHECDTFSGVVRRIVKAEGMLNADAVKEADIVILTDDNPRQFFGAGVTYAF